MLRSPVCWMLLLLATVIPAAERKPVDVRLQPPSPADEKARGEIEEVEAQLEELRALSAEGFHSRAERMERSLERLLRKVEGTKHENKACYWLAEWRLSYRDGDGVEPLLERLASLPYPGFKALGRVLRVRLLLRQGRVPDARGLAEQLVDQAPEFLPLLELVRFHEQSGQPAPRVAARNLSGGAELPLSERSEPYLIYCFIELQDPKQRFLLERLLDELRREQYQGRVRAVVVSFDGDPLAALARLNTLAEGSCDLLWVNPHDGGDGDRWRQLWRLPQLPVTALLGPDRTLFAVDPDHRRLRPLAGLDADDAPRQNSGGLRGRKSLWQGG